MKNVNNKIDEKELENVSGGVAINEFNSSIIVETKDASLNARNNINNAAPIENISNIANVASSNNISGLSSVAANNNALNNLSNSLDININNAAAGKNNNTDSM